MHPQKPHLFVLNGKTPVPVRNLLTWAEYFETADRRVAETILHIELEGELLDQVRVSTVFLGIDHSWGGGPPELFETMVFRGLLDAAQGRCSTWAQAEAMHQAAIDAVKNAHVNAKQELTSELRKIMPMPFQQLTIYRTETIK